MKNVLAASASALALMAAMPAAGADLAAGISQSAPLWNWAGSYVGMHAGGMLGVTTFSDHPSGPSIFGNEARTPGFLFGIQAGHNWQRAGSPWVLGVEADISGVDSDGRITCLAYSGLVVPQTCQVNPRAFATLTARAGHALGPDGRTLVYAKAGAVWSLADMELTTNNPFFLGEVWRTHRKVGRWGWTAGAGIEHALTPAWSLRLEYNYIAIGSADVATPSTMFYTPDGSESGDIAGTVVGAAQHVHAAKIGINYRIGADPRAQFRSPAQSFYPTKAPSAAGAPGWEFEIGARYSRNWNRLQWTNAAAPGDLDVSRLTYDDRKTDAGEIFGRVDTPWNVFAKGIIGGGKTRGGHMNDEDFGLGGPSTPDQPDYIGYTNTLHRRVDGDTKFATFDLGYTWLRGATFRVGAFAGYHYFREYMGAFGCEQIASPDNPSAPCAPGNPGFQPIPATGSATISQRATWQALRLGLTGEYHLTERVKLSAEAAYLPYVSFSGQDTHFSGNSGLVVHRSPMTGHGRGVQLEAALTYALTDQFAVGVGARYSAMWTDSARYCMQEVGKPCSDPFPMKAVTEQAAVFVQGSYRFGGANGLMR